MTLRSGSFYITGSIPAQPQYSTAIITQHFTTWVSQHDTTDVLYGITASAPTVGQLWPRGKR